MKISAAVTRAVKSSMTIEQLELKEPRADEILVRLVATGVCHTDIAMRDQAYPVPQPIVLGHEGAGVVEAIGAGVSKVSPGDHVVMTYNSCGHCPCCIDDAATYCHDFFGYNFAGGRPDGSSPISNDDGPIHGNFFGQSSFATHSICHERNIVKVRDDAALELLGPLACGVQTGAGAIINVLEIGVGATLAVFGTGSVGLSGVMAARLMGATTIIGIDLNDDRLVLAKKLGCTHTINASGENPVERIMEITGTGVDFCFETTGAPAVIRQAMESLTLRGTCGIVGASPIGTEISLDVVHLMTAGRSIRGIVEGESNPDIFIPALIDLYMQGQFPFDKLITFYPFEDINQAIDDSESGKVLKSVVRMNNVE